MNKFIGEGTWFYVRFQYHGSFKFIKNLIKEQFVNFKDICKGCASKGNCTYYPAQFYGDGIDKCPCNKCLIKGICRDACEKYIKSHGGNVIK